MCCSFLTLLLKVKLSLLLQSRPLMVYSITHTHSVEYYLCPLSLIQQQLSCVLSSLWRPSHYLGNCLVTSAGTWLTWRVVCWFKFTCLGPRATKAGLQINQAVVGCCVHKTADCRASSHAAAAKQCTNLWHAADEPGLTSTLSRAVWWLVQLLFLLTLTVCVCVAVNRHAECALELTETQTTGIDVVD